METSPPWIAVVDDEESIRRALLRLIDSAGWSAYAFASGAELIGALEREVPCCVVLDLQMPGMDGHQLQAQLAILAPNTHVIAMTGQHSAEAQARVLAYACATYLRKPMPADQLLKAIDIACTSWWSRAGPTQSPRSNSAKTPKDAS